METNSLAALLYGWSNEEIRAATGASVNTASRWRTGATLPRARYLKGLARLTGRRVEEVSALVLAAKKKERA